MHMNFKIIIDGQDYTKNVPFPIKWESLLDERLDEGRISLKHCTKEIFSPMTPVQYQVNGDVVKNFIISADESAEIPVGSGFFDHEISLIEQTKILEGIVVETLTFTNDLGRNYTDAARILNPNIEKESAEKLQQYIITPPTYKSPLGIGSFTFPACNKVIPIDWGGRC